MVYEARGRRVRTVILGLSFSSPIRTTGEILAESPSQKACKDQRRLPGRLTFCRGRITVRSAASATLAKNELSVCLTHTSLAPRPRRHKNTSFRSLHTMAPSHNDLRGLRRPPDLVRAHNALALVRGVWSSGACQWLRTAALSKPGGRTSISSRSVLLNEIFALRRRN